MYKLLSLLLVTTLSLLFTACQASQLSIKGLDEATVGFSQHYSSEINSKEELTSLNYEWEVISQDLNYTLGNSTHKELDFKALQVGTYTLKLTVSKESRVFSNTLEIEAIAPDVVDGHILPPEPDETLNNSTLAGIDINNNGVRDDVERWIYLEMDSYMGDIVAERIISMQDARASQLVLTQPSSQWPEVVKKIHASIFCWFWYEKYKKLDGKYKPSSVMEDAVFNTKERVKLYWKYNVSLSGQVFSSPKYDQKKYQCTDLDLLESL